MAFDYDNNSSAAQSSTQNERWKAKAFLNLWLRRPDGSRVKVGAIALRDDKEVEKALINRLQQDGGVEAMMPHLEADFQMAQRNAPVDLGF